MPEYRKSALSIHRLNQKDQQWLLARLSDEHRSVLQSLLAELTSLGIPKDEIKSSMTIDDENQTPQNLPEDKLRQVDSAEAKEISILLKDEPEQVIAAILSIYQWHWRAELMQQYSTVRQNSVVTHMASARRNGISDHLRQSILSSLAKLLDDRRELQMQAKLDSKAVVYKPRRSIINRAWRSLWPA